MATGLQGLHRSVGRCALSHVRLVDIRATPRRPHLTLDLSEFKFDPRYAAEYLQRHLKPRTGLIDLLDDANEGRERTFHHTDQVILLEHHEIGHGHLHHQQVLYHGIDPNGPIRPMGGAVLISPGAAPSFGSWVRRTTSARELPLVPAWHWHFSHSTKQWKLHKEKIVM